MAALSSCIVPLKRLDLPVKWLGPQQRGQGRVNIKKELLVATLQHPLFLCHRWTQEWAFKGQQVWSHGSGISWRFPNEFKKDSDFYFGRSSGDHSSFVCRNALKDSRILSSWAAWTLHVIKSRQSRAWTKLPACQQKSKCLWTLFFLSQWYVRPNLIWMEIASYPECEYPTFKIVLHFKNYIL